MSQQPLDVSLLRNALRMVHCLQKERGSSLYYCSDKDRFETPMLKNRSASDVAAMFMQDKMQNIKSNLKKIRNLIDTEGGSNHELFFHRIFVCFNILTSAIMNECIIPQVPGQYRKSIIKKHKKNSLSMELSEHLKTPEHSMRRPASANNLNESPSVLTIDPESMVNQLHESLDSNVHDLLNLLHIFVQLKESAGIERAILSTVVVFRQQKRHSIQMMLSDLVLQVENQRSLVHKLEHLPSSHHRNLVLELSQLSPRLKELQTFILNDFEALQNQNYDSEGLWNLLTEYIDKLHSVELLIVEDLEISLPFLNKSSSGLSTRSGVLRESEEQSLAPERLEILLKEVLSTSASSPELLSQINSMSAEEVKMGLIGALDGENSPDNGAMQKPTIKDLSSGSSLNQDMQVALQTRVGEKSKEWDISIYEIRFNRRIGEGASATTYLADWSGQKVAVKVASITEFGLDGWRREVAALQRLHHPNVIRLMGSIEHQNPLTYCLVLEYCNAGDLNTVLKYPTPRNFFFHVGISIGNAMAYLHSRHIVHRDLKPHNVLLDGTIASGKFTVKVTDFGVAADHFVVDTEGGLGFAATDTTPMLNLTGETGTYRWMAPEVIRHEPYSGKADVYSFAVILWQLLTHDEPFVDLEAADAANLVANNNLRPPFPVGAPTKLVDLIKTNWNDDASERWKFDKLAARLEEMKDEISLAQKQWLDIPDGHPVYVYDLPDLDQEVLSQGSKGNVTDKGKKRASGLLGSFFGVQKTNQKKRTLKSSIK
ncbi:MAG: hypothetical protein SGBAC_006861 [Bacillariaceae sp.]